MVNSYILLRDNVESRSLSFEELKATGLTHTDLIWVECQSVCWQSPAEITELKALLSNNQVEPKKNGKQPEEIKETEPETHTKMKSGSRSVFVELPLTEPPVKKKAISPVLSDSVINKFASPDLTGTGSAANKLFELNTRYSQSRAEQAANKEQSTAPPAAAISGEKKTALTIQLKKIAPYAGFFIAGALVMLVIKGTGNKNRVLVQQEPAASPMHLSPAADIISDTAEYISSLPESYESQTEQYTDELPAAPVQQPKSKTAVPTDKAGRNTEDTAPSTELTKATPPVQKQIISHPVKPKPVAAENIIPKLKLRTNEYKVGSFGGIRNLEITLQNSSDFPLDKVTVEIQYLNPEGDVVNSDMVYFKSLEPGASATVPVKKSKRGVKLTYQVSRIEGEAIAGVNDASAEPNNYTRN